MSYPQKTFLEKYGNRFQVKRKLDPYASGLSTMLGLTIFICLTELLTPETTEYIYKAIESFGGVDKFALAQYLVAGAGGLSTGLFSYPIFRKILK
ncbi:MAG: hypothetical protein QXD48_00410 [Candidatus Aenigmatarchaeota archaeon]